MIPESPFRAEEKQRWDERKQRNEAELDFLAGVEQLLDSDLPAKKPKKQSFLRRRSGHVMRQNRYELERSKSGVRQSRLHNQPERAVWKGLAEWRNRQKKAAPPATSNDDRQVCTLQSESEFVSEQVSPEKTQSLARFSAGAKSRPSLKYPKYTHHHHTDLTAGVHSDGPHTSVTRQSSKHQATVLTRSKRDRLAMKHSQRKAMEPQRESLRELEERERKVSEAQARLAGRMSEARKLKQDALEEFRRYQEMNEQLRVQSEAEKEEFQKARKKEWQRIEQRKAELDRRERELMNIPNRKEREQLDRMRVELQKSEKSNRELKARLTATIDRMRVQIQQLKDDKRGLTQQLQKLRSTKPAGLDTASKRSFSEESSVNLSGAKQPRRRNERGIRPWKRGKHATAKRERPMTADLCSLSKRGEDDAKSVGSDSQGLPEIPLVYRTEHITVAESENEVISNPNSAVRLIQHSDGKTEEIFSDGSRKILFPNGTEKCVLRQKCSKGKNRKLFTIRFTNGDVKKLLRSGEELYRYTANKITHVAKTDGSQLFFFESQHEVHFPDGSKHILFEDGTTKWISPGEGCLLT